MTAVQNEEKRLNSQKEDVSEMMKLLTQLTDEDKRAVKNIMIGITMARGLEIKTA